MEASEDAVFPIARWDTGVLPQQQAAIIRFHHLVHSMQSPDEATPGRWYALSIPQLRELIPKMQSLLQTLETSPTPPHQGPQH